MYNIYNIIYNIHNIYIIYICIHTPTYILYRHTSLPTGKVSSGIAPPHVGCRSKIQSKHSDFKLLNIESNLRRVIHMGVSIHGGTPIDPNS